MRIFNFACVKSVRHSTCSFKQKKGCYLSYDNSTLREELCSLPAVYIPYSDHLALSTLNKPR